MLALDFLPPWLNTFSFVMLVALGFALLFVAFLSLRNPLIGKLGVRNIPRRPAQTVLIVAGLTLSTIIITSALVTGDTLDYSIQRYAVDAYGEIDEIISPPLLALLAGMHDDEDSFAAAAADADATEGSDAATVLFEGTKYETIFNILRKGLPGISTERYLQLQLQAMDEDLIDGVAPAIVFPTIIRNTRSGQGEPLGFIFAVDQAYDQQFGLHDVEGQAVQMEALNPGVGNIFESTADLLRLARRAAADAGLTLDLNTAAVAVIAAGSLASGDLTEGQANAFLSEMLGQDAPQLPEGSVEQLQGLLSASGGTEAVSAMVATDEPASAESVSDEAAGEWTGEAIDRQSEQPIPALAALNVPDATNLLSSLNLTTMRAEIDRVLGTVGLQLRQGDVYLSRLGAERLDARTGDLLEIYLGPIPLPYRVAGIVDEAGPLATLSPVVMMDLDEAQQLLSPIMPGRVNAVLISNKGDAVAGIQHTTAVSDRLRILALEESGVEKVAAILSRPDVLHAVERQVAREENMMPGEMEEAFASILGDTFTNVAASTMPNTAQLVTLPNVLRSGDLDALRPILANLGNRTWLLDLPVSDARAAELQAAVSEMTQMEVLDPLNKQSVVNLSGVAGTLFSTVFSIFGIFSIMAGVLLIFMIFVMLAAERRSEMGMARATGMQRSHLVQMFVTEGMLYDLAAALVGVGLGLSVSYLMIGFLGGLFNDVSSQFSGRELFFQFRYQASTPSIIIAYCAGVLFTFVVVTFASYRVSRLNIVAAIRGLPDRDNRALRSSRQNVVYAGLGPALLTAGAYVIWRYNAQGLTVILLGVTLILFGANVSLNRLLATRRLRAETRKRVVSTLTGLAMVLAWGVPWEGLLGEGASLFTGNPAWVPLAFALSAPMIIVGSMMIIMFNVDVWVWAATRLVGGVSYLTPVLRTAIAYPLSSRFRTGTAMTLFAMIISTVVVMSIVIQGTQTLVTPDEERTAGFDIELKRTLLSFFDPVTDLETVLPERAPTAAQNVAVLGQYNRQQLRMRQSGTWGWDGNAVSALNNGFINQMAEVYPLRMRAEGYADDTAVWQALQERDDVAVVTSAVLPDEVYGTSAGENAEEDYTSSHLWLVGMNPNSDTLPGTAIEILTDGGEMHSLQVIGMLEAHSTPAQSRVLVHQDVFTRLNIEAGESSWFVAVAEGADVGATARALESAFLSSGLDAVVMADSFAQGQQITRGILQLFQGFMALGLLVGIAALGVISSRTVLERRQQVGMLRAIGYQPGMVALSFVLESSFIALMGIGTGTLAGVLLGRNMLVAFFDMLDPGAFTLPWLEIGGILLLAYVFSLVTTILPAYQASRIYPAEALRYEF